MKMRRVNVEDDDGNEPLLLCRSSTGRKGEEKTNHGRVDFEGLKKPVSCDVLVVAVEVRGCLCNPRAGDGLDFADLHPHLMNRPPCQKKKICRA